MPYLNFAVGGEAVLSVLSQTEMEVSMRKMLMALSAAAVIGAGTVATPTPSHAMAPLAVAAIVVGGIIVTVMVVHHAHGNIHMRHHRRHHRHH